MQLYPVKRRYNYESFIQIGLVVSIIVSKSVLLWIDYVIYLYKSKCGATDWLTYTLRHFQMSDPLATLYLNKRSWHLTTTKGQKCARCWYRTSRLIANIISLKLIPTRKHALYKSIQNYIVLMIFLIFLFWLSGFHDYPCMYIEKYLSKRRGGLCKFWLTDGGWGWEEAIILKIQSKLLCL